MPLLPIEIVILEAMADFSRPVSLSSLAAAVIYKYLPKYPHMFPHKYQHSEILNHALTLRKNGYVDVKEGRYTLTKKGRSTIRARAKVRKYRRVAAKIDKETTLGNKYVLKDLVGKGTYGVVWKARDKTLDRIVAVKLLHGGIKDFEQLESEGKALSALGHKNILIVHDLGSDEENGWLVTEFVDGPSLEVYLGNLAKEGKWLSFEEARNIVEQCLEALEFAHDKDRIHGDIKPANIFMPETGEIKLGDFGVAKILSGDLGKKEEYPPGYKRRLGSSSCAAPEVLKGMPRDFQSDLFSVGVLAYILLTGQHPFIHKSGLVPISELIESDTYTPPRPSELIEDFPEKYEKIVMHLLEKDKSKRYQKAREVLDEWRKELETVPCPRCNTENPVYNKFCGQCGNDLRVTREVESVPEKDLSASYSLFTAGRPQDAIGFIQRSLDANPNFARGWTHLGYMLNHERKYEEAELACTKSIEIDPEPSNPFQTRGFARSNLGKFDEAIEDFTVALEKETDERRKSMILYQRGYAKRLAGRLEDAYQDAMAALQLDETNVKARKMKEVLEPLVFAQIE